MLGTTGRFFHWAFVSLAAGQSVVLLTQGFRGLGGEEFQACVDVGFALRLLFSVNSQHEQRHATEASYISVLSRCISSVTCLFAFSDRSHGYPWGQETTNTAMLNKREKIKAPKLSSEVLKFSFSERTPLSKEYPTTLPRLPQSTEQLHVAAWENVTSEKNSAGAGGIGESLNAASAQGFTFPYSQALLEEALKPEGISKLYAN